VRGGRFVEIQPPLGASFEEGRPPRNGDALGGPLASGQAGAPPHARRPSSSPRCKGSTNSVSEAFGDAARNIPLRPGRRQLGPIRCLRGSELVCNQVRWSCATKAMTLAQKRPITNVRYNSAPAQDGLHGGPPWLRVPEAHSQLPVVVLGPDARTNCHHLPRVLFRRPGNGKAHVAQRPAGPGLYRLNADLSYAFPHRCGPPWGRERPRKRTVPSVKPAQGSCREAIHTRRIGGPSCRPIWRADKMADPWGPHRGVGGGESVNSDRPEGLQSPPQPIPSIFLLFA